MDLLSSLLRVAQADEYLNNFRSHSIDPFTLKLLDHEDLEALGITDENKRKAMLKNIANLQVPAESRRSTEVDNTYVKTVLYQMSNQLHRHLANLSCAIMRKDVIVCDIPLGPSVRCLKECLQSLENETRKMKKLGNNKNRKNRNKLLIQGLLFGMFITSSLMVLKFVVK